jgi:hypothetical protein
MAVPFRLVLAALVLILPPVNDRGLSDEPAKPAPKSRTLDPAKLPPNAVIIVSDNPREALQNVDAVVLTPDEYKKLLEAAEHAKRLANPDKPEPPSVCRLRGTIETRGSQDVAVVRAEFQFRTTSPRAMVLLGLQKGRPVSASIDDGKLAILVPIKEDESFAVQVDSPGEHHVAVELEAPVATRGPKGGERGVELGLPGAAITTVERLTLPPGITRARLGGRNYPVRQFTGGTPAVPSFLLGPTQKLDLAWDAPAVAAQVEPQTIVDGRYDVRVEDRALAIRARLTFKVQAGLVGMWEVIAPPTAELTCEAPTPESPVRIQKPQTKGKAWVIRRELSAADLVLDVTVRAELTPGQPVSVPGFVVSGASQQRGTITVGGPPHLRLAFRPAADVTRREAADDGSREAVFTFFQLPESGSPLAIDAQPARGDVETQCAHQLTLAERGWRWQGKLDVRPIRTEVTAIDLEVPSELQELRPASVELVEGISPVRDATGGRKVVRIQLAEARRKAFSFTLEGLFPVAGAASAATLSLPRLLGTLDHGGSLAAMAPVGLELRGSYREWEGDRPGEWDRPIDPAPRGAAGLAATLERTPARVDLTWRAPRADVLVTATADLQLGERQVTVRHQWRFPGGPTVPRQFIARGSAALAGRVRAVDGGTLTPAGPAEWNVQITAPAGRESVLTLAYSFPMSTASDRSAVVVPLVWLDPCLRCETDVRVWSAATLTGVLVPAAVDGPWTEVPPRAAPDRPTFPALAVHGSGTQLPLTLRLKEAAAGLGMGLVVDRVWVQAVVNADGQQEYRTRCVVRPQQTHYLDVELPAAPTAIQFAAQIDGKRLPWTVADSGPAGGAPGGRFVRLRLDPVESARTPLILDLIYLLPPQRSASRWQLTLVPPRLLGTVFVGPVRWQIGLTSGDLLVDTGDTAAFDWWWGWQRGLLAPRPGWTATDFARWFMPDARTSEAADPLRGGPVDAWETALVGWQPAAEPLRFLVVPRALALLLGSLAVLAIGFAAIRVGPTWRLAGAGLLIAAITILAIGRPQALAWLLYTAEPGLAVLAIAFVARWAAQRRYRRRVLFLPAFARAESQLDEQGRSSLVRNGAANRGRREPTTVDRPANASSQAGLAGEEY